MQDEFYDNVINNKDSKHRYFAIVDPEMEGKKWVGVRAGEDIYKKHKYNAFIGMGGLTNIEWENGTAEISLIINPEYRGKGYGRKAVELLLQKGFGYMRLFSIYGEVYTCGNYEFWTKVVNENNQGIRNGYMVQLPNRKFHNNTFYGSLWFSLNESKVQGAPIPPPYKVLMRLSATGREKFKIVQESEAEE